MARNPLQPLRITPLGGLGEIGMNCMVIEYADEILVVDCGILFSDLDHFGVEFIIPRFDYLMERRDKIAAFLITHGHEDHIGALPWAFRAGLRAPVYASRFSSLLVRKRMDEHGLMDSLDLREFRMGDEFTFKNFKVKTTSVNHSIVDAAALLIETPLGKVIHTGDFKIDSSPYFGSTMDLSLFRKAGDEGALLLLSDSTNVERQEHSLSENDIFLKLEQAMAAVRGMTVVSMFASNVARMAQVFEVAKKTGKKVALSGRTMEQNVRFGAETGYLQDVEGLLIPIDKIEHMPRNKVIVLSTGSQGEARSSLIRISQGEHADIQLREGDTVILSSKFIPGNEIAIGRMINGLFREGAEVLYEAIADIHTSGHATAPELREMLEAVRPKFFVPIHGEYRHLVHHAALAKEAGVRAENVRIAVSGQTLEITPDSIDVVEEREDTRLFIEGRNGNDISRDVLKNRRKLAETGAVFVMVSLDPDHGKILSGPEVVLRGVVREDLEGHFVEEAIKVAREVIDEYRRDVKRGADPNTADLAEEIRIQLRRFFHENVGKKPVVVPVVI